MIDSHCHLTYPGLVERLSEVLERGRAAGVTRMITVGVTPDDADQAVAIAQRHAGMVYAAAAYHPHHAEEVTPEGLRRIAELWRRPPVVACGEMGLDYHYDFADRAAQRNAFAEQLSLANSFRHPLIIHCREAFDDVAAMLSDHGFTDRPVVFHCFTGGVEEAARIAEHGWRISFTGIVTFKRSQELQEIARGYPADRLMIETDSPYLSPEPVRAQRPNEPANVAYVARFLARLRGVDDEVLACQTERNTRAFFSTGNSSFA